MPTLHYPDKHSIRNPGSSRSTGLSPRVESRASGAGPIEPRRAGIGSVGKSRVHRRGGPRSRQRRRNASGIAADVRQGKGPGTRLRRDQPREAARERPEPTSGLEAAARRDRETPENCVGSTAQDHGIERRAKRGHERCGHLIASRPILYDGDFCRNKLEWK